MPPMRGD